MNGNLTRRMPTIARVKGFSLGLALTAWREGIKPVVAVCRDREWHWPCLDLVDR